MSGFIALSAIDNYSKAERCLCKIKFKRRGGKKNKRKKKKKGKRETGVGEGGRKKKRKEINDCKKNGAQELLCRCRALCGEGGKERGEGTLLSAERGATPRREVREESGG